MIAALGAVLRWSIFVAVLAAGAYFATLAFIPGILMSRAIDGAANGAGFNIMSYPGRSDATTRFAARPNPDVLLATCAFNISQNQLRLKALLPKQGQWSLTIYGEDAKPFYFQSNDPSADKSVDAVLVEPGGAGPDSAIELIHAPTFSGLILIRSLIETEASLAEIDGVRHQASCHSISR